MILVKMRDGTERYFDQIRRERIPDGWLTFQSLGAAEIHVETKLVAEIHIRKRKFAMAAE